jgi:hypothetical protein
MTRRTSVALTCIAPLLATGCLGDTDESRPIVVTRPQIEVPGGMAALVRGRLAYSVAGRCFTLGGEDGGPYPVVWPAGTTPMDDPFPAVVLADGTVVRQGDAVEGAGGFLQPEDIAAIDGAEPPIPAECRSTTGEVAVFNHSESVRVSRG